MRLPLAFFAVSLLAAHVAAADKPVATAKARIMPTEGSTVRGTATFARVSDGVLVSASLKGLTPESRHGFHIHMEPDCSAPDGSSAGPHWNPSGDQHGHPNQGKHHLGDMPNLQADAAGEATLEFTLHGATLATGRKTDLMLRSLIVHADEDDYATQPTGNAGARLACGVVQ